MATIDNMQLEWIAAEVGELAPRAASAAVKRWAETLGVSVSTINRRLRGMGIRRRGESRRKGKTRVPPEALRMLAHVISKTAKSKEDVPLMCVQDARNILVRNGVAALEGVSVSRLSELLREHGISARQVRRVRTKSPAVSIRTDGPNHIHFFDASVCPQFFYGGSGITYRADLKATVYKNKPKKVRAVYTDARLMIRYGIVDAASGAFYVDYFEAPGEQAADAIDFLWMAWSRKSDPRFPFHGVPKMVVGDKGSATLKPGSPCHRFVSNLGVRAITHAPGNPRAKGAVEQLMNWWERRFESRLALEAAPNLAELRARAHAVQIELQNEAVHTRHNMTRFSAWMRIEQDSLRELPRDERVKRDAASYAPTERVVTTQGIVKFDGREWRAPSVELYGRPVLVYRDLWDRERIEVVLAEDQTGPRFVAEPLARDQWGYVLDAKSEWGEPRRLPDTAQQREFKDALRAPLPEDLKAFPETTPVEDQRVVAIPRVGEEISPDAAERRVSNARAIDAIRAELEERGVFELTSEDWSAISRLGETVTREEIDAAIEHIVATRLSGGTKEATA